MQQPLALPHIVSVQLWRALCEGAVDWMHTQRANRGLIVIVTIAVPLLAVMLIAYMLLTAEHP
jgi:hypothetical protein